MSGLRKKSCGECPVLGGKAELREAGSRNGGRACSRCVCDESIPGIRFDEEGVCQFCRTHESLERAYPKGEEGKREFEAIVERIKKSGKGLRHDCVAGVSGGRDSSFLLRLAVESGLRPLAVHFDNGWNSEAAVSNIKAVTGALGVELCSIVADWEEFRDVQTAFLKASVPDADIPTDVAIFGALHKAAAAEGVKYILNGHSFRTEGIVPKTWTYMDGRYVRAVHSRFGSRPMRATPNFGLYELLRHSLLGGMRVVPLLNYVDYGHEEADEALSRELGWRHYGGHHHECLYTRFIQSCYLPAKFGIDKRMIELSALVRSGLESREKALETLSSEYKCDRELVEYVLKKLGQDKSFLAEILSAPPKTFLDYPSYYPWMKALSVPVKLACKTGLLPELLWEKYLS